MCQLLTKNTYNTLWIILTIVVVNGNGVSTSELLNSSMFCKFTLKMIYLAVQQELFCPLNWNFQSKTVEFGKGWLVCLIVWKRVLGPSAESGTPNLYFSVVLKYYPWKTNGFFSVANFANNSLFSIRSCDL